MIPIDVQGREIQPRGAIVQAAPSRASAGAAPDKMALIQQIANFYAGKPVNITYDVNGKGIGGMAVQGGDHVQYTPDVQPALLSLLANYQKADHGDLSNGVQALATLIHEALHTRGGVTEDPVTHRTPLDPSTGLYGWDDEWQAHQLSYGLIADALQRFLGVKVGTPLAEKYLTAAKSYSWTNPVNNPFGGPDTPNEIAAYGERTLPQTNPWGWYYPWANG